MKSWTLVLSLTWLLGTSSSAWANNAVWIDVASQQDYAAEHVVDALHIPYTHIARGVSARFPDKTTALKLYDRDEQQAARALEALQTLGYAKVTNSGALLDLKADGLATEQAQVDSPAAAVLSLHSDAPTIEAADLNLNNSPNQALTATASSPLTSSAVATTDAQAE